MARIITFAHALPVRSTALLRPVVVAGCALALILARHSLAL
ncbi:hypothetical protein [Novosphingobium sp. Leaf2]|nr:hypothetical protein [Novosphingobium sp. Leaf2]